MSKPTQSGKKYIQLTDNILLEFTFVTDRCELGMNINEDILGYGHSIDDDPSDYGTYGKASKNSAETNTTQYVIAQNEYTKELYFINDTEPNGHLYTNNSLDNTVLPIKKDASQWVRTTQVNGEYYSSLDTKWCNNVDTMHDFLPEHEPDPDPTYSALNPNNEYIPYDIVRIYFQSGYHTEYDGFIFNFYTKDILNKYVNLLCAIHENKDINDVKMVSEPMWFADKIYTTYIEYRIPSVAYLSSDCAGGNTYSMNYNHWMHYNAAMQTYERPYSRTHPSPKSLPDFLTHGNGFYSNPAIGIDVHAIVGYGQKREFKIYKTRNIVSTLFPNKDTYDKLFACVRNAEDGDYFDIYGYYENDPSNPQYYVDSLYEYLSRFNGTFTVAHIITVTENYTDLDTNVPMTKVHAPMTYIQTWENLKEIHDNLDSPVIKFRPVLEHTANMIGQNDGAIINYTLRIISNRDSTSIIKTSASSILNPRRYGKNISVTTINNINDIHVYNRIEPAPTLNINAVVMPIGAPSGSQNVNGIAQTSTPAVQVNRYVTSSFIQSANIMVSVSPINIEHIE